MDFTWALKQMNEGKEVRRPVWCNKGYRMYLEHGMVTAKTHRSKNLIEKAYFKISDFRANDWEYYEEPMKTLSDKTDNAISFGATAEVCTIEDVKEFIEEIKEELDKKYVSVGKHTTLEYNRTWVENMCKIIDKFAGDRFK